MLSKAQTRELRLANERKELPIGHGSRLLVRDRLAKLGLLEAVNVKIGADFPIDVTRWRITPAGKQALEVDD